MNPTDLQKNLVANGRAIVLSLLAFHLVMFAVERRPISAAGALMAIVALGYAYVSDFALLNAYAIERDREPAPTSRRVSLAFAWLCIASTGLSGIWAVSGLF